MTRKKLGKFNVISAKITKRTVYHDEGGGGPYYISKGRKVYLRSAKRAKFSDSKISGI